MGMTRACHRKSAAVLLAALALALPRLLVPPGFMPGMDHAGHAILVFCDPSLRAAFSGHVHSHTEEHADGGACPFGMSGGPALLAEPPSARLDPKVVVIAEPAMTAGPAIVPLVSSHRARAPPRV
jgi:hypothetical protein